MFGVDSSELFIVAIAALVFIGPKDLPRVMRLVGQWVGRARGMARHVRSGFDTMVRESEIEEMNKRWQAENEAIMAATRLEAPAWPAAAADPALPAPATDAWSEMPPFAAAPVAPATGYDGEPPAVTAAAPHPDPARP